MASTRDGRRAKTRDAPGAYGAYDRIAKSERLLNLVAFLLNSRHAVPFSQIKGRVRGYDDPASPEALEKRFDRDKAELRALGVPIVYEPLDEHGVEGYRIPREEYFLPEIRLGVEEAAALAVVQRYAVHASDDPLAAPLLSALRKVIVDSPLTGAAAASVTEQHRLGVRTRAGARELGPNLEALTDAAVRHVPVRFRYYSIERDVVEERTVEPYGIGWHRRFWYLVGLDAGREAVRQFRVDRINGRVRVSGGKPFQVPDDFDIKDHVGRPAFLFGDAGQGERVVVHVRAEVAFMVRDALREGWEWKDLPDGSGLLSFDATERRAVLRFVAQHVERARILEPASLADQARDHIQAILDRHTGEPSRPSARRAKTRRGSAR